MDSGPETITHQPAVPPGGRAEKVQGRPFGAHRSVGTHTVGPALGTSHHSPPGVVSCARATRQGSKCWGSSRCCAPLRIHRRIEGAHVQQAAVATVAAVIKPVAAEPTASSVFQITDRCTHCSTQSSVGSAAAAPCLVGFPSQ